MSDLQRTRQTWEQIVKEGVKFGSVYYEPLLREKSAGEFEGKAYGSQAKMARQLKIDVRKYRPLQGESHDDVLNRALTFIKTTTSKHLPHQGKKQLLLITHGGFISEFYNATCVLQSKPLQTSDTALNCSVHVIQFTLNAKQRLCPKTLLKNDTSHLKLEIPSWQCPTPISALTEEEEESKE